MKTKDLITILSNTGIAKKPMVSMQNMAMFTAVISAIIIALTYGVRPDIMLAITTAQFWVKTLCLMLSMLCGIIILRGLIMPAGPSSMRTLGATSMLAGLAIMVVCLSMFELIWSDHVTLAASLISSNTLFCMAYITALGALSIPVLTIIVKQYAPLDALKTATAIGFLAGSCVALGYSFHCMVDFGSYILIAYSAPIIMLSLAARKILPKYLSW